MDTKQRERIEKRVLAVHGGSAPKTPRATKAPVEDEAFLSEARRRNAENRRRDPPAVREQPAPEPTPAPERPATKRVAKKVSKAGKKGSR